MNDYTTDWNLINIPEEIDLEATKELFTYNHSAEDQSDEITPYGDTIDLMQTAEDIY